MSDAAAGAEASLKLTPQNDLLMPEGGWASPAHERLPAPADSERGIAFRSLSKLSRLFGRGQLPAIFPVFHINPRLFWAWLFFASRLMPFGRLAASSREKLILRTAWNCRSRYEWGQHVELALKHGVSDTDIMLLATAPQSMCDDDALLMQACDDICRQRLISEATWSALAQRYSQPRLIEIMILVGHYEMVAGLLINSGIELEETIEAQLQAFHQRISARI